MVEILQKKAGDDEFERKQKAANHLLKQFGEQKVKGAQNNYKEQNPTQLEFGLKECNEENMKKTQKLVDDQIELDWVIDTLGYDKDDNHLIFDQLIRKQLILSRKW